MRKWFLLLFFYPFSHASYCQGGPQEGERINAYDILHPQPVFQRDCSHGSLSFLQDQIPLLKLNGTPYEMGFAQGTLLRDSIRKMVDQVWSYIETQFQGFPIQKALEETYHLTRSYTPSYVYEEMRGICDASGIDCETLRNIHLLPELTKGSCSFLGAWGHATIDHSILQVRALDWDVEGPYKNFHQITVYEPDQGHSFITVGFTGFIGAISGMSKQGVAISEIGIRHPDDSFGQGTRHTGPQKVRGQPFVFMLRDLLQFTTTHQEAYSHLQNMERTCNLVIGYGDSETVVGFQYSGKSVTLYNDSTLLPVNETWHPQLPHIVYNAMDWLCPSYNRVLYDQLEKYNGQLSPLVLSRFILPTVQTGNLHIVMYDLSRLIIYIAFGNETGYAYEQPYFELSLESLF